MVQLHRKIAEVVEGLLKVAKEAGALFEFEHNVVDVDICIDFDLFAETLLHCSLVCCSQVIEAEKHWDVTEWSIWCDEGGHLLITFLHTYLVISKVCVQKA